MPGATSQHPMSPMDRQTPRRSLAASARLFGQMLRSDVRIALQNLVLNQFCASFWVPQSLRRYLYRAAGMRIDSYLIGPNCRIEGDPRNVRIGASTYMNVGCYLEAVGAIHIGELCDIGMQVLILTSDHSTPDGGKRGDPVARPVRIGNEVWIGARAIILPGVDVADDVIIGAGAIVTRDCLPHGFYAGVPARRVRDLPSSGVRHDLG